ncbi:MAG: VOC family protein [Microbacterium sp.]|nr:VOC family protein [Microbacterium sp.]
MIALDHIAIWSDNLYKTTIDLSEQTGIGSTDGGYFPDLGLGQKLISLGPGAYIEVESIVDHRMIADGDPLAVEVQRQTFGGACFAGLCLRSDDISEIEAFAAHVGVPVSGEIAGGKRPVDRSIKRKSAVHAPDFRNAWLVGKPNVYLVENLSAHPSTLLPQPGSGDVLGEGITAIEIGGTEAELRAWLGPLNPDDLGITIHYNGGPDGLYAVSFASSAGPQTIRLNPITL